MVTEQTAPRADRALAASAATTRRRRRPAALLSICTLLYGLVLLSVAAMNALGPDRWWIGSVNLYLPQWPWAIPAGVLLVWHLARAWRRAWIPVAMLAWVFGPLMGWSFGLARLAAHGSGPRLRVMTYNVKWGTRGAAAVIANVDAANPDVLIMQDSNGAIDNVLAPLRRPGWHVMRTSQYTILSRYPLTNGFSQWFTPDRKRRCLRCTLQFGATPVVLYDVHLMTPRYALSSFAENGADGVGSVEQNAAVRMHEAAGLADHVRTMNGPIILAGDLNSPIQTRACDSLLAAGLRDAFTEAGWGYGYTYGQSTPFRRPFLRIDHVMVSREWQVESCSVGSQRGSDHSPIITDLRLVNSSEGGAAH